MFATIQNRRRKTNARRGGAAVELAVCMPFLMALAFGMLEYNNMVMLRTRMVSAAYESARLATRPTTSEADAATASAVISYCNSMLTSLGVVGATVTLSPSSLSGITPQTPVTVTITAPFSSNSLTTIVLGSSTTTTASATLIVE
jgi:Flp pilus assembly protein TadG